MTQEEIIIEGNKLIAEFMGGRISDEKDYYTFEDHPCSYITGKGHFYYDDLFYSDRWDWLMPVVEKIEALPCVFPKREAYYYTCYFTITSKYVELDFTQKHFTETFHPPVDCKRFFKFFGPFYDCKSKIDAANEIIVEFLKWYNQNHQQ